MEDLVSVVITTYKRPIEILERAIDSAVNQTYKKIEVIVVNDYPEDVAGTELIKSLIDKKYIGKVKYIDYERNMGACYARNYGAKHSLGKYIAFLDDDDTWVDVKIAEQIKPFNNKNVGMVYSPFYEYDSQNSGIIITSPGYEGKITNQLLERNFIGGCSMTLIRKSVFDLVGGFDEKMLASQDYDLWLRISIKSEIVFIDIPLSNRYLSSDSISVNFNKKKQGWERFDQKYCSFYDNNKRLSFKRTYTVISQSITLNHNEYAFKRWRSIAHGNMLNINTYIILIKMLALLLRSLIHK